MALQLTGAKTLIVAGSPLSCIETYTGEAYEIPYTLTSTGTIPAFTPTTTVKYYEITATSITDTTININDIQEYDAAGYSGYTIGSTSITSNSGKLFFSNLTPSNYTFGLTENPILLAIITLRLSATSTSSNPIIYREPIGVLIRYQ